MKRFFWAMFVSLLTVPASATVVYNSWTSVNGAGGGGNYILTIANAGGGSFNFNLTVNPWNAEALGLFVDLGNLNVSGLSLTNVNPVNQVSLFATDTTSNGCGTGCNLNGLSAPVASPDSQWEMVFRLGDAGFDSIQTFSWRVNGLSGVAESNFGLVGIRSQQLCDGTNLLPDGSCGGSDKSYGSPNPNPNPSPVPEPSSLWLLGMGLLGWAGYKYKLARI